MRLRSLALLAAGIGIGVAVSRKLREDDPDVVVGPVQERSSTNPAIRAVSGSAQRLAGRAQVASLEAIRRARGAIRERLVTGGFEDDAAWN